jgi:hypothetical protein
MARIPLSEFVERMNVAREMLREAYPNNPAVEQLCEAISIAGQVVVHISLPFLEIVEDKIDIQR